MLFWVSKPIQAVPAVTVAAARAFLGGRTGKIAYLKNYDSQLYFINLSDSGMQERRIATVSDGQGLVIAFDGSAAVSGVEVFDEGAVPILVTAPKGGERFRATHYAICPGAPVSLPLAWPPSFKERFSKGSWEHLIPKPPENIGGLLG